jgi:ABC-type nitrate/sulfonate/bicarbonate transport system ATPase subunit
VDLLLLDEPFGSMDLTVRTRAIVGCRAGLASGRIGAAILVTHNLEDVASLAQKVLVLRSHPGTLACEFELSTTLENSGPENSAAAMQLLKSKVQEGLGQ